MGTRGALVLVAVVAGLAAVQPAAAVSRPKAQKAALAALKANKVAGPVIVFGLPKPLAKGVAVSEAGSGPAKRGKTTVAGDVVTFTEKQKGLPAGTWLFWMDLAPYAHFEHPSVMVIIGANGKVVRKQALAWWPLVNGKAPAFFTPSGYASTRYRVFSHGITATKARRTALGVAATSAMTASKYPNDCIVLASDEVDSNFAGDRKAIAATATKLGIPLERATSAKDLEATVEKLANAAPKCTDVIIYLDAHGYPATGSNFAHPSSPGNNIPESAHAQVALAHIEVKFGPGFTVTTTVKTNTLDAVAVRKVMAAHMNLTFKLVVDACFSGRWSELSDQSNLRVILAASRSDQMSFGYIANNPNYAMSSQTNAVVTTIAGSANLNVTNTYQAGGFTNAITTGLATWLAISPNSDDLAKGLAQAFNLASTIDASQIVGITVPGLNDFTATRPHAPPGTPFTVSVAMTYRHIGPGKSEVCVKITTTPARARAAVHLRVAGPGVVSGGDQTLSLGDDGTLFVRIPINQFGDYTAGADVTAAPGDTATAAGQETVSAAQGDCPAS